jgi:hypothetical protein
MPVYTSIRRWVGRLGLGSAAALLLWANWQEPNLHDYPAPIGVAALQVAGLQPGPQAVALHDQLVRLPGVTACTISADAHSLAFTYQPSVVTPAQVQQQVARSYRVQSYVAPATPALGPQCPVPLRYVTALEQLRFTLNLRRLFIRV